MKILYLIFIGFVLFLVSPLNAEIEFQSNLKTNSDTLIRNTRVTSIKSIRGAFIVDVYDSVNNQCYRLLSPKGRFKGTKIQIGKDYMLRFWPSTDSKPMLPNPTIKYIITIESKSYIVPSTEWTGNIYLTKDLKGLIYLPE